MNGLFKYFDALNGALTQAGAVNLVACLKVYLLWRVREGGCLLTFWPEGGLHHRVKQRTLDKRV